MLILWLLTVFQASLCLALTYSRHKGLLPSFSDPDNFPTDAQLQTDGLGYEDNNPAFNPAGIDIPITGFNYRIFDSVIQHLKCYDVGFCECDPTTPLSRTVTAGEAPPGDPTSGVYFTPDTCLIAPNWVTGVTSGMEYKISHRHVDASNLFQQHDVRLISADINRALHQWPLAWKAVYAEIITWKITHTASGKTDKFQVVLTLGNDGKTYVMYLYETIGTFATTTPVRGILNGVYLGGTANVKSARVCPSTVGSDAMATSNEFVQYSNFKCGKKGLYLFKTEAGDECLGINTCVAYENVVKPSCNHSSIPADTCTESFSCHLDENDNIILDISLKWYRWKSLKALDYSAFIGESGGGTVEDPQGVEISVGPTEKCRKDDLPNPGSSDPTIATYTLTMPENSNPAECGTVIDTVAKTIKFAYKNYDYDPSIHTTDINSDVVQDGDVIVYGTCHYSDLPVVASQTKVFNDPPAPTELPPRARSITLNVVDRETADGIVLSEVNVGRDIYLRVSFDPGAPFNHQADPYCLYVTDCIAGNNLNFVNNLGSYHRSQSFIESCCPVSPAAGPIYLTRAFQADMVFSRYDGSGWHVLTGKIDAAKWYTSYAGAQVNTMYFKCVIEFGTKEDGIGFGQGFEQQKCIDCCEADNNKRRRRSGRESNQTSETLVTSVTLIGPEQSSPYQGDNMSSTISIVTIVIAVAMVIVAVGICILVLMKVKTKKMTKEKQQRVKQPYQNCYI